MVLKKFMSKKENDYKVDKLIKLSVLVIWTNKKKTEEVLTIYRSIHMGEGKN